jgi:hypothetical protein
MKSRGARVGGPGRAKEVSNMKRIFAMLGALAAVFLASGAPVRW